MARTAGLAQRGDASPRIVQFGQRRGFGQLDEQPPRRHAAMLQFAGNIFGQRRLVEGASGDINRQRRHLGIGLPPRKGFAWLRRLQALDEHLRTALIVVQVLTARRQRGHRRGLEAALDEPVRGARGQHEQFFDLALQVQLTR